MKLRHLQFTIALFFLFHSPTVNASLLQDEADDGSGFDRQVDRFTPELIDSMEQLYHDKIGMFIHWGPYAQIRRGMEGEFRTRNGLCGMRKF